MQKPGAGRKAAFVFRLTAIIVGLALLTLVSVRFHVNATTAGFLYLLVVLFSAARWGLAESTVASVLAILGFNFFFLPPVGTLTIADAQNWVALLAFLATSVTASQLSATVRTQARQATERQREIEQLYSLSRAILLLNPTTSVTQQIAAHIARLFEAPAVVLYDKRSNLLYRAGPEDLPGIEAMLKEVASRGIEVRDPDRPLIVTAIRLGADPIGSLALASHPLSDSALQGVANLAAIGMERTNAYEQANRAEAARQSDELKSTLLDAVAHEFKTPLTSIKAASTTLVSQQDIGLEQRCDLLTIIDEEADRLSTLVTEAIQVARLESGNLRLNRTASDAADLVAGAAEPLLRRLEGRLQLEIAPGLPPLHVDADLLHLALRQLIDNAVKYSPPGTSIRIRTQADESQVVFTVQDEGAGIPNEERQRVFERFYRSSKNRYSVPGAGLGLAISNNIVKAHGGEIRVEGSSFHLSIPLESGGSL
jgi:two-component system, OmpR family, sensor histidine kinase KdpD